MLSTKSHLIALLTIGVLMQSSAAQSDGNVKLQFLSFPKTSRPIPVELLTGRGETILVATPSNELSPVYEVSRMDKWVVGKTITNQEGDPFFNIYGKCSAIKSANQLILLIRKGGDHSDGFKLVPVDNRTDRFGGGDFMFINASTMDIAGIVGDKKFVVKPGKISTISPKADIQKNSSEFVFTELFHQRDGKTKSFFSTKWPLNKRARSIIFFYNSPHQKNGLKMHTIQDFSS